MPGSSHRRAPTGRNPYAPHRSRCGKAPRPAHDSHVGRRKARRALEGPSEPAHTGRHRHCRGRRRHVGGSHAVRPVSATASAPANTSPAGAGFPTIASPALPSMAPPRGSNARRHVEDRLRAHDPGGEIGRLRQARAGPPSSLGPDGRLAARRAGRSVHQPHAIDGQRRPLDRHVCRRGSVPVQGDRRRRCPRQRDARHAGDCAPRRDHRIPGFPARSFIKPGVDAQPADGEWHDTPDKQWRWKGDTSSDEIVGHYFVYPIYYDLVATDGEKPALRAVIDRITNHILDRLPAGRR